MEAENVHALPLTRRAENRVFNRHSKELLTVWLKTAVRARRHTVVVDNQRTVTIEEHHHQCDLNRGVHLRNTDNALVPVQGGTCTKAVLNRHRRPLNWLHGHRIGGRNWAHPEIRVFPHAHLLAALGLGINTWQILNGRVAQALPTGTDLSAAIAGRQPRLHLFKAWRLSTYLVIEHTTDAGLEHRVSLIVWQRNCHRITSKYEYTSCSWTSHQATRVPPNSVMPTALPYTLP